MNLDPVQKIAQFSENFDISGKRIADDDFIVWFLGFYNALNNIVILSKKYFFFKFLGITSSAVQ